MYRLDAALVLEDGRIFRGRSIGARPVAQMPDSPSNSAITPPLGEVVFNTSMTGYQEIITDPSYRNQILVFTAPQIGNYGVCEDDAQTLTDAQPGANMLGDDKNRPQLCGIVVRESSPVSSNFRSTETFEAWLTRHGICAITDVDTRALTRHLRKKGAMRGGIFLRAPSSDTAGDNTEKWVAQVKAIPSMEGANLSSIVSTKVTYEAPVCPSEFTLPPKTPAKPRKSLNIICIDFGVKRGIVACLQRAGFSVTVVPADTSADEILSQNPDGVLLSNGPGDPAAVTCGIETARALVGKTPLLGICLGHQILGLALGGKSFKLPFGHHGGNHPVKDLETGEVWITAQNHGFAINPESLSAADNATDIKITHISLYDGTLEGFSSEKQKVIAIQFHPEASPGPSDAAAVFNRYADLCSKISAEAT